MRTTILIFLLFVFYSLGYSQVSIIDGDSTRMEQVSDGHGKWWFVLKLDLIPDGDYVILYNRDTTKPRFKCSVKNHDFIGGYEAYFLNGQLEARRHYNKYGKIEGKWQSWYENGQLYTDATYADDKANGDYSIWYENGGQRQICKYAHGKLDSTCILWNESGGLQSISHYRNTIKIDDYEFCDNSVLRIVKYLNDSLCSITEFYYNPTKRRKRLTATMDGCQVRLGQKIKEIRYYKGKQPTGEWFSFDENGRLNRTEQHQ